MNLIDHYVRAARLYLPRGPEQDDIIRELSENLLSQMEEQEGALGRPLTEAEQEAILTAHGAPLEVAERYGPVQRGVAFGRQIISPNLFPLYIRVLLANIALTSLVFLVLVPLVDDGPPRLGELLRTLPLSLLVVTAAFAAIERLARSAQKPWSFPPPHRQPVPRWQSVTGFVVLALGAAWWAALPAAPSLIGADPAKAVTLSPSAWDPYYWPALALLVAGMAQRAMTFVRPGLNGLQAATRLVTNGAGVVMVLAFLQSGPHVVVSAAAGDVERARQAANMLNGTIWWNAGASLGLYMLVTFAYHVWICGTHVRALLRQRRENARIRVSLV